MIFIEMHLFFVYWIRSGTRHYIGATVDPKRRLRQHNRELLGGAKKTRKGPWYFHLIISGFRTWREALQFEWAFKYFSRRARTIRDRESVLHTLFARNRWTSNSPLAADVPLIVHTQEFLDGLFEE